MKKKTPHPKEKDRILTCAEACGVIERILAEDVSKVISAAKLLERRLARLRKSRIGAQSCIKRF